MAETDQERTEEPTQKKLDDAKEKGQIARSKEMGTLGVLLAAAVGMLAVGGAMAEAMFNIMTRYFSVERALIFDDNATLNIWSGIYNTLLVPLGTFFAIVVFGAFVGNTIVGGFNFSWQGAAPKPSKMSPLKGFKRMFGTQALIELLKGVGKFLVVAVFAYFLLRWQFPNILQFSNGILEQSLSDAVLLLGFMFLLLVCSMLFIVVIDVPFQRYNHNKQLRMTKQEVKDERKNAEGSPEIKGKIRQMQLSMAMKRMMQDVPQADVVVTNPTHYAVALVYNPASKGAPKVVAKGNDEVAAKIREVAMDAEVPIVQSPALARAVYYSTKIGQEIPEGLFMAVAQVLAFVFQMRDYRKGKGRKPKLARDLPIPEDLKHD
ncbi:flagellar biosynthesis protein FlhB [Aliidiomarina maris]|uniref:Flagellar biosynthetic protein FlhB n=1 Tax=Aliidiomarina maris TaxID=531312 RepID=A0A327WYG8_9GAMM|nr:flagellar biosynthesis protein FlhB [Aliidiomarina maris]RAJ94605.1 flagellar biosynthetic protein FlhB [Aliidiomarina maris]RUO19710.1 flagellar biosynthesis protein FlhB [Aliidiomarina maris]